MLSSLLKFLPLIALVPAALVLSSCAGSGADLAGGGGGGGGGNNDFGPRTFKTTFWAGGAIQNLTLDTTADGKVNGSFAVVARPNALTPSLTGSYNTTTGAFSASGTMQSQTVALTGTLPKDNLGGSIVLKLGGKNSYGVFGVEKVNTLYFKNLGGPTDSHFVSANEPIPFGFIDSAGRLTGFETWGGLPHDAYIGVVVRTTPTSESPSFHFTCDDVALSDGSIIDVVPPATQYNDDWPKTGDCRFWYGEGSLTFVGVSGRIFIDHVDKSTGKVAFHTDSLVVRGAADLFGGQHSIGKFEVHGDFFGNYAESDLVGPF